MLKQKKSVLYVCIILFLSACSGSSDNNIEQSGFEGSAESVSYLALGDSYTIGTSIDSLGRWPIQLRDRLRKDGYPIDTVTIIATNGWTTDDLHSGLEDADYSQSYDLVSLLIGVNNQYRGYDQSIYKTEFRELLVHAVDLAGGDTSSVFVLSIPDYGITPFAKDKQPLTISKEIREYNTIARSICNEFGIPFIDITPVSVLAQNDGSLLASDSLHPSEKMYAQWVDLAIPVVKDILQNGR